MRSDLFGVTWPAVKVNEAAMLAALIAEIKDIQWKRPRELEQLQHQQLSALLRHHADNTPSFKLRLDAAGLSHTDIVDRNSLRRLPPLTRSHWQDLGESMFSTKSPSVHGKINKLMTSGSTGEPVVIRKTMICGMFWAAHSVLDHDWHHRDIGMRMVSIRADIHEHIDSPNWGYPMAMLDDTGPARGIPITTDIAKQIRIISEFKPEFIITYPNNLSALLDAWEKDGYGLELKHIKTIGETVSDDLRARTRKITDLEIEDGYSSNEAGTIAMHCGHSYHTMDDNLIVEVLDENGEECKAGEIGRVVVTDLHNFATPIVRYDMSDYAERSTACACGRGFGTLSRIMGRQRNLIRNPDGTANWPLTGFHGFRDVADIKQYQMIQHDQRDIELKLVTPDHLTQDQQQRIVGMVKAALKHDFDVRLTISSESLPRGKNGKFEEFICRFK